MNTLRQRKGIIGIIQELDAFPKVEEDHRETSAAGGGYSMLVFIFITILVTYEVKHYLQSGIQYKYDIDSDFDKKLKLNIDMMVAMKCSHIGADVVDQTGENADSFGSLGEDSVNFDLSQAQSEQFSYLQGVNSHLRANYHALHDNLWWHATQEEDKSGNGEKKEGQKKSLRVMTLADMFPLVFEQAGDSDELSGCRFRGSLEVNKVAGNFHITAGKSVPVLPRGHAHLSFMMRESEYNFSHRIFHLSFGEKTTLVNPLDGEEKIVDDNNHLFQYFIQVVPTIVEGTFTTVETYQYAATEQNRTISHSKGSHGLPGIFIKYDLSPLRVTIKQRSTTLVQLLVKLCAIVGGVFATSGIIHHVVSGSFNFVCCQLSKKSGNQHRQRHDSREDAPADSPKAPLLGLTETWISPEVQVSLSDASLSEKVPFRDL